MTDPAPADRAIDIDVEAADHLLTTTRAVRKRLDLERPVSPAVIRACIDIAIQAPTGSNAQKWRWVVVTDRDLIGQVAEHYRRAFGVYYDGKSSALASPDAATERMADSSVYLAENLHRVPALVIPCALGRLDDGATMREHASLWGGVLPAVWSFQLALRSRGLGSVWTTLHLDHEAAVADLLGIPDTVTQMALLPVAYYTGDTFQRAPRRASQELTYWNAWKHTDVPGGERS